MKTEVYVIEIFNDTQLKEKFGLCMVALANADELKTG